MPGKRLLEKSIERPYKRFKYSEAHMEEAVNKVKDGSLSLNQASREYNIPKATLHNKVNNKVPMTRKMGPATILTKEEEAEIKEWIIRKAKIGFPMHPDDVKDSIQKVLTELPRDNPFKDNRPGKKWLSLFMKRHPEIAKRNTEAISRARAAVTKESLLSWFRELREFLKENNCEDIFEDGRRILNLDETGCLTCPKSGKVLGPKAYHNFYEVTNGSEKESITVLCTYSADGSVLPPMIVYPYKRIPNSIISDFPDAWAFGRLETVWMVSSTFYEYVGNVLLPWMKNSGVPFPIILFLDGHKSHLTLQLSNLCANNQIHVYCLPPNATHIIQPCDVSIFRPLKVAWKKVVRTEKQYRKPITKHNFARLFRQAFETVEKDVIKHGFKSCGLFPLNPNAVDFSKCISVRREEIFKPPPVRIHPCVSDFTTTKAVIEQFIPEEKLQLFRENIHKDNCKSEKDESLFQLWKMCYNETNNLGMEETVETEETKGRTMQISTEPRYERELNIMDLPILFAEESVTFQVDGEPGCDAAKTTICDSDDFLSDAVGEDFNIVSNNYDFIEYVEKDSFNTFDTALNVQEQTDHISHGCDVSNVVDSSNRKDENRDNNVVKDSCNSNVTELPDVPQRKACEKGSCDLSLIADCIANQSTENSEVDYSEFKLDDKNKPSQDEVSTNAECSTMSNSSSENNLIPDATDAKSVWAKHLYYPEHPSKIKKQKKDKEPIPFCITSAAWREMEENKLKDKAEKEKALTERKKAREEKRKLKNNMKKKKKTNQEKQQSSERKVAIDVSNNKIFRCPGCQEQYADPPTEDWIECDECKEWWHEHCTSYEGAGFFVCVNCED